MINAHNIIQGEQAALVPVIVKLLTERISALLHHRERLLLGLAGGRSVAPLYAGLAQQELDWSRITFFLLDERLVPPDHPESNFQLVNDALGGRAASRLLPFCSAVPDPLRDVADYNARLHKLGNRLDIVIASSGEDGHIASLFPGHDAMGDPSPGFILVDNAPKPPAQRMSASHTLIGGAALGLLLFFGSSKQDAFNRFCAAPERPTLDDVAACPAQGIATLADFFVFTDLPVATAANSEQRYTSINPHLS